MGVGCCALVSLFERDVCAWQGQQQLWTCWWGRRRPKGVAAVLRLPARLCARLAVASGCCSQVFHTIHSATQLCGSPAPPPRSGSMTGPHKVDTGTHTPLLPLPKDKKPGLGYNLKPTTDTKLFSRLQKPCVLQHSQKGYSYTKSAVSRDCSSWTMCWPLCAG